MIRTTAMMIGGLLLLLIACPLHALAKIGPAHHKAPQA
jgi:type IV secretory pathway VirB3-like protein